MRRSDLSQETSSSSCKLSAYDTLGLAVVWVEFGFVSTEVLWACEPPPLNAQSWMRRVGSELAPAD